MSKTIEVEFLIGDKVYVIQNHSVIEMTIEYIYVAQRIRYHARAEDMHFNFRKPALGRNVFFTREEAELKLTASVDVQQNQGAQ